MALACLLIQLTLRALPFSRTTANGLQVAATASMSDSSGSGSSMLVRSPPKNPGTVTGISSPSSLLVMPTTAITISASLAAETASGETASSTLAQINCARGDALGVLV